MAEVNFSKPFVLVEYTENCANQKSAGDRESIPYLWVTKITTPKQPAYFYYPDPSFYNNVTIGKMKGKALKNIELPKYNRLECSAKVIGFASMLICNIL